MKPLSFLSALLAVAVLSAVSPARASVPLKDLRQDKIRAWAAIAMKAGRDDPARADFWKQVDALLVIDPDRIVYEHDKGVPVSLVWECKPRRNLDVEERLEARKLLRKVFDFAMFQHDKGLVTAADAKLLDIVTRLEVGPNPGPRKRPAKVAAPPLKELTQDTVRNWFAVEIDALRIDPTWVDFWKETDELLVIDPDIVVYEQEMGVPVKLVWEVVPRRPLTAEERLKAREDMRKLVQYVLFEQDKGLVAGGDVDLINVVTHVEIAAIQARTAENPEDCERLRRQLEEARLEIERLRLRLASPSPARTGEPREARRYVMVVQPSSMIYYDCPSHCWLPGPASVLYYPVDPGEEARPRPPAFIPPPPTPDQPPAVKPPTEQKSPEKEAADAEEAGRVFWVGYRSYWQGDYDRALASFDSAVRIDAEDARFWYYKALSERALGDAAKAEESARRGRQLHAAQKPKADLVGAALERVQGQERRFLNAPEVLVSDAKDDR